MSDEDCRSPIGLDCCSCCLDLAHGCDDSLSGSPSLSAGALPPSPTSPSVNHFRQLRNQLMYQNLNTDKLNNIMRQDSLESVVRDPCFLLNEGICNSNIDQTMLSILLFFHRQRRVCVSIRKMDWHALNHKFMQSAPCSPFLNNTTAASCSVGPSNITNNRDVVDCC
ncbi:hypothetical protein ATANTOWER_030769 [Ataeniobius toweri]|uniref:TSC22 domain family protein 3 n=1 Tax=Ataeniobius toweri TaxID=208326 RepID=A0ABU7BD08_9TELE|nr:hypothetical protein [Ataeniobius toweri]